MGLDALSQRDTDLRAVVCVRSAFESYDASLLGEDWICVAGARELSSPVAPVGRARTGSAGNRLRQPNHQDPFTTFLGIHEETILSTTASETHINQDGATDTHQQHLLEGASDISPSS